jgi:hypothetical protein
VEIGPKLENRIIIQKGLKPGEKIVTSGDFLIDSESKLKSATGEMGGPAHGGHGGAPSEGGEKKPSGPPPPENSPAGQPGQQAPSTNVPEHEQQGAPAGTQQQQDHSQHK